MTTAPLSGQSGWINAAHKKYERPAHSLSHTLCLSNWVTDNRAIWFNETFMHDTLSVYGTAKRRLPQTWCTCIYAQIKIKPAPGELNNQTVQHAACIGTPRFKCANLLTVTLTVQINTRWLEIRQLNLADTSKDTTVYIIVSIVGCQTF